MKWTLLGALAVLPLIAASCSTTSDSRPEPTASTVPAAPPEAASSSGPGVVAGRTPTSGNQPAIVVLQPRTPAEVPQAAPPVMDQVALTFIPGLLVVRTGHPVEFRNSDDQLHNVRVNEDTTKAGTFNVAIPMREDYRFTFERDGFYNVGCDIHPAMSATIYSSPSPYNAVTDLSGQFEIRDVPPGSYTAIVFAGAERLERAVEVGAARTDIDFTK
jgi:plastocyanin